MTSGSFQKDDTDLVQSVSDFLRELKKIERHPDNIVMFRGHANKAWKPLPGIMRSGSALLDAEKDISREIVSQYPHEFDQDQTMFDRLCRMQHFGIATRLLDVTANPLVALYFATDTCDDEFVEPDGTVGYFDSPLSRRKYYDSDTVSCIANLANLTNDEKEILNKTAARTIKEFNDLKPVRRLLQFIRSEKPYFLSEIIRKDMHMPLIVIPKLRNRRIIAQHGAFMIFGLDRNSGPKYERNIKSKNIFIDAEFKKEIRKELEELGLHDGTLFPEIDKASAKIMHKYQ